ncbi:hypothetical protein, partial [Sutterella wadsworthensis]|uniref:hypothetical protein n=1 Tax=Sutterella wadsworthensis TaxID=40545 RepID=UPI0019D01A89
GFKNRRIAKIDADQYKYGSAIREFRVSLLQVDSFSVLLNKHSNGWSADQPFSYAAEGRNLDPP